MRTPPKPHSHPHPEARRPSLSTWWSRAALSVIVLVLLMTTLLLARFGLEDFVHDLTFAGRLTGAVLLAVSFTTLVGAAAVLDHWIRQSFPYSGLVALIGTFAALLTNAMLLAQTVKDGESAVYPALFGVLTAGSAYAAFVVWRTSVVIPAPKRVAAAVIVSSVIAAANFGYQNLFQPYQRQTQPLITVSMGKPVLSKDRKAFAVPVDITLQNHGEVGFYVLGTEFHAMGKQVPLSPKDRLRRQWRADAEQWRNSSEWNPLSRREMHQPGELVEAKPWMPYGSWVESNDTYATRMVVQLPMNTPYDQVAFYATASLARKDRLVLQPLDFVAYSWGREKIPGWVKAQQRGGLDSLLYRARVHENNALDEHTRDPRFITVYWQFGTHGANVSSSITRKGEENRIPNPAENREVASRYGLVDLITGPVERTLWDVKSQR
ncbi:hypothetical protein K7396_07210 [Streptomyces angustmyceticus]|uniref:Uncharacterized protein n=1 Tax=Streptomyces angustmyceticus TaxID=285578 RepID=A0A5J4LC12_9ACTN|nr:hypothetical protein K7396_07210 [Streptomyces angustmyceticus]GES28866.1 hypothetical protein San01_13530 [Streptomyces angustmyceticus]